MSIERWSERIWVIKLHEEPAFSEDISSLLDAINHNGQTPDLVIDLASMQQLNSSHLSRLLRVRKVMVDREAKMRLAGPPNSVWAVFLTTGLDKVFEFSPDVGTALAGLQMSR